MRISNILSALAYLAVISIFSLLCDIGRLKHSVRRITFHH